MTPEFLITFTAGLMCRKRVIRRPKVSKYKAVGGGAMWEEVKLSIEYPLSTYIITYPDLCAMNVWLSIRSDRTRPYSRPPRPRL